MLHYNDHFRLVLSRIAFPREAASAFADYAEKIDADADFGAKFDRIRKGYLYPAAHNLGKYLGKISALAGEKGVNAYTLHMVFLISCSQVMLARYIKNGISEDVFWATIDDFRCKNNECMECEGVPGTFVGDWNDGFFRLNRFACGRFQYEYSRMDEDYVSPNGIKIKKGQKCLQFHIPSSGVPLTDEVRLDSYKQAYKFFPDYVKDGKLTLMCHSWLLYKPHREFLPKNLNILRFMDDFDIVESEPSEKFGNGWRVFGKDSDLPVSELPENTSLQRAYKQWLLSGNKAGNGEGIIVFDGEKICNK